MISVNIKQLERLFILKTLQDAVNELEHDKFHITFFIKDFNFINALNPFFSLPRLIYKINGDYPIDHVGFIKQVYYSKTQEKNIAQTVDAFPPTIEINDLIDFTKNYKGKVLIVTLPKTNQKIVSEFSNLIQGLPYSELAATKAGIDSRILDKMLEKFDDEKKVDKDQLQEALSINGEKMFCSFITALILEKIGYLMDHIEKGRKDEMTPLNIFQGVRKYAEKIRIIKI